MERYICVIPIRMTEAWLLFDENAIRKAVGNPNGRERIALPPLGQLEDLPNSKEVLFDILIGASGLRSRQRKRFKPEHHRHLIAREIRNFRPLLALSAFRRLDEDIRALSTIAE